MQPQTILDFGCGHGCVARMLRAHFPKARIVGQDVHADWMDWCGTHLGIETVVSPALIADVTLPENSYDLIWAGSIFSHLPESAALHLLAQFRHALTPTGIAVFSTAGQVMRNAYRPGGMHNITDAQIAGMTADFDAGNHAFCAYDKTIYDDWGHSLIPCQWMFGTARRLEMPVNGFYESGWGLTQDVYGLRKAPNSVSWR
jgi:SAM-dependent methyltransferase